MKRNRESAATPIPPLSLDLVHTKTFSCQKSFVTRNIKIQRGNWGGGVILVPFHCKKIKFKPGSTRAKCQLYFVPERILWDKKKLTAEVPKVDRNIRSGMQGEKGLPQQNRRGNGAPIAESRKLGGKGGTLPNGYSAGLRLRVPTGKTTGIVRRSTYSHGFVRAFSDIEKFCNDTPTRNAQQTFLERRNLFLP